jgi:hypothetical protein
MKVALALLKPVVLVRRHSSRRARAEIAWFYCIDEILQKYIANFGQSRSVGSGDESSAK